MNKTMDTPLKYGSSFWLLVLCFTNSVCCVNINVAILVERSAQTDMPFMINRTLGLINMATEKAKEIVKHSANLNFILRYADVPVCTAMKWGSLASEVYHTNRIHAIIGPGCSNAVTTVARLAASWNIPHITFGGTASALGNKTEFSTLSRLCYNLNVFAKFYIDVLTAFRWTDIAIIYDATSFLARLAGLSLQRSFMKSGIKPHELTFSSNVKDVDLEIRNLLEKAKTVSRVFLVSCHGNYLRKLAIAARTIGLRPSEYTIIFFLSDPSSGYIGNYKWQRGDQLDSIAQEAYESVMIIRPRRPVSGEFYDFEKNVKETAFRLYNYTWKEGSEVGIFNIAQYDSFILLAMAVNKSLSAGEDPSSDGSLLNRLRNVTFAGIAGLTYVNEIGDRETDFTLLDQDHLTGEYKVVAQYLGYTDKFELIHIPSHWTSRSPHPNKPKCGFTGELCINYQFPLYGSVTVGFSAAMILIMTLGLVWFRRLKSEAALQSNWWRVKWHELDVRNTAVTVSTYGQQVTEETQSTISNKNAFESKGLLRGIPVFIRKLSIKSLTVDRKLLLELKQMREINCPNLTRLLGVCPDKNNVCIITEYCCRGTLKEELDLHTRNREESQQKHRLGTDILQNESMNLEIEFRVSLINDIVQGMHYIHKSPIEFHGCLSSSTCAIDSRFVLKVSGFGLRSLNVFCRNGIQSDTSENTIEQIQSSSANPLRPSFNNDTSLSNMIELAQKCWKQDPEERPTFSMIRRTVHEMQSGQQQGKNVLDMLLHRMEQYANNLEGLVQARTNAFLEEKKKSEALLYEVLPRSIAEQLRSGQTVIPEEFVDVTLYFSDIVGFTSISASSTPLQIVDFLNDVYTCFDETIEEFDVYKVETIGDAYMVVSGLPIRNGDEHARQIARMSLRIVKKLNNFIIRHKPETPLRARIGIHSGSVVAGVVGRKMPRYCLFGDTVNTASRMESKGEPMMIHISDSTRKHLDAFGDFIIEERGLLTIKEKEDMLTHWLIDEKVCEATDNSALSSFQKQRCTW